MRTSVISPKSLLLKASAVEVVNAVHEAWEKGRISKFAMTEIYRALMARVGKPEDTVVELSNGVKYSVRMLKFLYYVEPKYLKDYLYSLITIVDSSEGTYEYSQAVTYTKMKFPALNHIEIGIILKIVGKSLRLVKVYSKGDSPLFRRAKGNRVSFIDARMSVENDVKKIAYTMDKLKIW